MTTVTRNNLYLPTKASFDDVYFSTESVPADKNKCNYSTWKRTWVDFTESTTLHGIRHIWTTDAFRLRRLIWLLLVLTGIGIMSFQIIDRILYFRLFPANVNVDVNFNETLPFPAVTLCNQNAFRATAADADNRYRLIEAMFTNQQQFTSQNLSMYDASEITMWDLYSRAAHRKQDLIFSCKWGSMPCSVDNFTVIPTDHGICYTFNNPTHRYDIVNVTNAGIEYGLRLILNVEQYEYMPGPHDAAGVKLFIHDQDEFPLVGDLGLAVPTGSHTFVGNSLFVLNNLEEPHGECGEIEMKYFPNVTTTKALCKINCMTIKLAEECGCRHAHLPHINDYPPVCTLQQMYDCTWPFIQEFHERENEICRCPVPCVFQIYEPSISYATTSSFVIDKLLSNVNSGKLQQKYIDARETTHRLERDKFETFKERADDVKFKLASIEGLLKEEIDLKLQEQREVIGIKRHEVHKIWKRKNFVQKYQLYALQKNFLRARDAMEERTLSYIGNGFQAFALDMDAKLHELAYSTLQENCSRDLLYLLLSDKIDIEVEMINRGKANLTELIEAYMNGTSIFNYKYSKMSRSNNPYIVPKKLLNDSLYRTWNARNYGLRIAGDLETLKFHVLGYKNLTEIAYYNRSLDEDSLWMVNKKFIFYNKRYFHNKANLYYESLDWPEQVLEKRLENFTQLWIDFTTFADDIESNIDLINASLNEVQDNVMPVLRTVSELSQRYLQNNSSVKKLEVANVVLSPNIHEGINTMKVFFQEVRSRGQAIFDDWTKLAGISSDIWRLILTDEDSQEYYRWRGYDNFLQNVSSVLEQEEEVYAMIGDETDIRDVIGNRDRIFYSSLYDMMSLMGDFKKSTKLDENFLRENFVFLDVYYNQLSYEEVTQQEDYPIFSLLCDIGGSMGLFLGASAMSIFEIIDLVVNFTFRRALE